MTNGTSDASVLSDDASSVSSTPILALKRGKKSKEQKSQKKKFPKKPGRRPRGRPKGSKASSHRPTKAKPTKKAKAASKQSNENEPTDTEKKSTAAQRNVASLTRVQKETGQQQEDPKVKKDDDGSTHSSESEEDEEQVACCLCQCGVDCSDRALFFSKDRKSELEEDEDYYFGLDDPYMDGDKLYDRNNALVYCDTCNRLYHQKCHFVPILVVPRGEFHCLICTMQQQGNKNQKRPSKKRDRKGSIKSKPSQPAGIPEILLKRSITDQIFQAPPNQSTQALDISSLEKKFELVSGVTKARLWDRQFKQLKTFLKSQASNIRMAKTTLETMTSTKRNRQHFLQNSSKARTKSSQELAQTLCKITGAKFKIRDALLSLEALRTNTESINFSCLYSWCEEYPQHASHVFPFGSKVCKDGRRIVPRTRERKQENVDEKTCSNKANGLVPSEIVLNGSSGKRRERSNSSVSEIGKKYSKTQASSKRGEKNKQKEKHASQNADADDDSGITLDDLQCSICMIGDSTDCNDVILCDGKDCHRAFHMKCVHPAVKPEEIENEDEDWFCPICSNLAELMGEIHDLCVSNEHDEDASSNSWDDVHDVFPGSQWEFETATKYLKGKRNEDTQRLLSMFLGDEIAKNKVQMPIGSDSEDENDYSLFDEDSFQERRRQERDEESSDDDSVCSSQATLQEMDDIDLKVGKAELAALSEEEQSESEESDDESNTNIRRSRRLVKQKEGEESKMPDNGADFDEANIILGKRRRTRVNYRKLNDMMFGDLTDHQQGVIDGGDDFDASEIKATKTKPEDESQNDESNNDSDNESENNNSDDQSDSNGSESDNQGDSCDKFGAS